MDYREHIQRAIDYIEDNLKSEIDLNDCARAAGYSVYHFLRVFYEAVRLTPADYIRKRRLSEIVRKLEDSGRPICDIAFEFGFNSKENFIRAFKTEHHILPTAFRSSQNSLKLYDKFAFEPVSFVLNPEIAMFERFSLTVFKSDEPYTPNFWNKYNSGKLSKRLSGGKIVEDFGAVIWNDKKKKLDYFIGIRTSQATGDICGTLQLEFPAGTYAVFETPPSTHFNFVNTIHRSWEYIHSTWLNESDFLYTGGLEFESYVENSRTYTERIYIPVKHKQ